MSRQIYQKYGFIIALIIAGISLPTSIISLTREPTKTTNNYYNTYNNQTFIPTWKLRNSKPGNNETENELEPYYIQESFTVLNLTDNPAWLLLLCREGRRTLPS